ncbi:MAG: cytochrome c, partial [Achromobacter sp.]|nr:cytochrome c [Achromobacter sp.]
MVSNAGLALAVAAAPAGMLACLAAARRRPDGHAIAVGLPLSGLAALALAAAIGVVALGWQRTLGAPGLLGSRLGHLA